MKTLIDLFTTFEALGDKTRSWLPSQLRESDQPDQGSTLFRRTQRFGRTSTDCCIAVNLQQPQNCRQACERMAIKYSWMSRRGPHVFSWRTFNLVALHRKGCMINSNTVDSVSESLRNLN